LLLPFGTSIGNRYRRTNTLNWIGRPDSSLAHVDGEATQFPGVSMRWAYRPTASPILSSVDASVGYVRTLATASLPNLFEDVAPEIRRPRAEQFPISGSIVFPGSAGLSSHASYSFRRQTDSLPGSIARSHGNELSVDAGRAFHVPASLGLGFKNDLRTRFG